jgi:DNA-binding NarL/FixJ family response regulator
MSQPVRIILVLHNRILREGICVLLNSYEDLELVAVAVKIDDLRPLFTRLRPDLVLIDLDLPAGNALDGIKQMKSITPWAWIIGLTTHEGEERCVQAIEQGAATVVAKDLIGKMLVPLIRVGRPARSESYEYPSVLELVGS